MNFLRGMIVPGAGGSPALALEAAGGAALAIALQDVGASKKIVAGVRPEHVVTGSAEGGAVTLDTTVERVEQLGATTFAYCVLPNGERLTVQSAGQARHAPGEALRVALPLAYLHVFDADDGRSLLPRA